ncbi:lamin tail domain-containing protein [Streptomyces sp. NPDC001880]
MRGPTGSRPRYQRCSAGLLSTVQPDSAGSNAWVLVDASNHKYTFGSYTLGKGKTVTIRTGKGKNTATNLYQNRGAYVWNNDKDTATLKKSNGSKVDSCSYNSTRADYKMC